MDLWLFVCALAVLSNAEGFVPFSQNETSITLQWNRGNSNDSFVLQFNGTETNISAPDGDGPINYTVSSLTAGTKYTFTLLSRSSLTRVNVTAATAPENVETLRIIQKNDSSVTLQWSKVNFASYVLQYNQGWKNISASDGDGPITYTVSSLSANTEYIFTLFSVFENTRSSGVQLQALTDQQNVSCGQTVCPSGQDCVIINGTAQCGEACQHYTELNDNWLSEYNINRNSYCSGSYNSTEGWYRMFVGQTSAQIPETCVQDSRCGYNRLQMKQPHPTQYNQTVTRSLCKSDGSSCCSNTSSYTIEVKLCYGDYYVYKLQTLPGCDIAYCAVPKHSFRAAGQDETSITLRWNKVNNSVSFVLLFNGTETNISAPAADDSVTYTVSSLTAATKYTFTLFSVFDNVRSSGISIDAFTAPPNPEMFSLLEKNDTSVTLQWSKAKYSGYLLNANNRDRIFAASDFDGPTVFTVSSLYRATEYTFTLFSVFENTRSSGVQLTVLTDHRHLPCGKTFCAPDLNCFINNGSAQCVDPCEHYTALSDWSPINRYCGGSFVPGGWYSFFLGPTRARITETCEVKHSFTFNLRLVEPHPTEYNQSVTLPVCPDFLDYCCDFNWFIIKAKLCYGDFYVYKLFDLHSCYDPYSTVPSQSFQVSGQTETSITLQWDNVNNNHVSFILEFNGTETNISAPNGDGPIFYTITSLTAGTKYTFTVFSVIENVRGSPIKMTAVTAPPNAKNCKASGQNESSITLQWDKVNTSVSFVLQFNGTETNISAPAGDAVIHHTVSSLTAGTKYTFTLFSVFENVRSTGVNITAATAKGPHYVVGLDMELESVGEMTEAEMLSVIEEFLQTYGLSPNSLSVKVKSVQP